MTDPIADMLTRIRNAQRARKAQVYVPFSKLKMAVLNVLKQEGYIEDMVHDAQLRSPIVVTLKYIAKKPMISSIVRTSKPGHRVYKKTQNLPEVLNGYGCAIVSTSEGVMTEKDAKKRGIGGEVLCTIY